VNPLNATPRYHKVEGLEFVQESRTLSILKIYTLKNPFSMFKKYFISRIVSNCSGEKVALKKQKKGVVEILEEQINPGRWNYTGRRTKHWQKVK